MKHAVAIYNLKLEELCKQVGMLRSRACSVDQIVDQGEQLLAIEDALKKLMDHVEVVTGTVQQ